MLWAEFIDCTEGVKFYISLYRLGGSDNSAVFGLLMLCCGSASFRKQSYVYQSIRGPIPCSVTVKSA